VVTHRFTRHGPVFFEDTATHHAYAMRSTMHMPGSAGYLGALRFHAVRDCAGFLDALQYYRAPSENMICGDASGNIAWQASAASPRRPNWHGRLPVPGTGEYEWKGLRADLPREFNPARGWIATANHNIHPPDYDPPLFFGQRQDDHRFQRLQTVFSSGRKLTLADHQALQHDAFDAKGASAARLFRGWTSAIPEVERARAALADWDGQHRRESVAAALFRFVGPEITGDTRDTDPPASRQRALEPAIGRALDSLRTRFGQDPAGWRWGRFNRSEFRHPLARPFDIPGVERHGGSGFVADDGATFRELSDMMDLDASLATNAPGQSGQPGSPFYDNLAEMFGRAEYFPLAFSRAAVERYAAHRLTLRPRR
jgi:penicillin G amidase